MATVAVVIHSLVGDMSWAVAFALGAIVSPPDSIAATQIAGKLGLPRRLVTILGGEGLMNDATALTAYQLAIAAVGSTFTLADVFGKFFFAVFVGVAIGMAVGWIGTRMLRFTETPVIENTMLLILPFAAYLPADKVGASGVLAVVATGLYFGRYGSSSLTAAARLQQREIWDLIVFLLTGMSFLLVGLELRPILDSLVNRESGSLVVEALAVVGVVIVVRMVWIFGATALPGGRRLMGTGQRSSRSRRETTVIGWAGMRGAVSLAAALALPQSFPAAEPVGVPGLRRHRGHPGRSGTDPPTPHPAIRAGDPGRAGRGAGGRGPATADGAGAVVHRRPRQTDQFPDEVVDRIRIGYESQLARIDRRLERRGGRAAGDGPEGPGGDRFADGSGHLDGRA